MVDHPGAAVRPVVLVVAKAPVPGTVKTRLCPPATLRQAAEIAAAALLDTLDAVAGVPAATAALALAGNLASAVRPGRIRRALRGWTVFAQRGATFADRLANAHAEITVRFPGCPVLQIGMDTPQVTAGLLGQALDRLAGGGDALVGPATDGGWWALGLVDPRQAGALVGVPTSRPDTGSRTRRALRERGLRVRRLPALRDVDTMRDAVSVAATVPGSRFAAAVAAVRTPVPPLAAVIEAPTALMGPPRCPKEPHLPDLRTP
jgi:glycosyltransferase A (GT-A) superfamily protein (DUF2064 family)